MEWSALNWVKPIHAAGLLHGESALLDDDCGDEDGGCPDWCHAQQQLELLDLVDCAEVPPACM
jgi:hypothetical protein